MPSESPSARGRIDTGILTFLDEEFAPRKGVDLRSVRDPFRRIAIAVNRTTQRITFQCRLIDPESSLAIDLPELFICRIRDFFRHLLVLAINISGEDFKERNYRKVIPWALREIGGILNVRGRKITEPQAIEIEQKLNETAGQSPLVIATRNELLLKKKPGMVYYFRKPEEPIPPFKTIEEVMNEIFTFAISYYEQLGYSEDEISTYFRSLLITSGDHEPCLEIEVSGFGKIPISLRRILREYVKIAYVMTLYKVVPKNLVPRMARRILRFLGRPNVPSKKGKSHSADKEPDIIRDRILHNGLSIDPLMSAAFWHVLGEELRKRRSSS